MHIKQVVISGFRSFRNQCEIEPFSPKHNVIVGRNGSGKSNFFDAIQFVLLGPRFSTLRQEDRQHLLHEGAGTGVMAAYVEILFDNIDGRLPIEGDEVVLRRTVGHKKDEFFINRKRCQKSEVTSLLESAGFSKSNPYYIVQQGKVANLCVMKDKDRLNLLREVAGTTVYEERRVESLRILQDTSAKQERIVEVITFIKERLDELDKEKDELKEYEQLDKNRRALEYNIYDRELHKANEQLAQMEATREEERERQHEMYTRLLEVQDMIQSNEDNLSSFQQSLERMDSFKKSKQSELVELSKKKSSVEAELQEIEASFHAQKVERDQVDSAHKEVLKNIAECEAKLARVEPEYETKSQQLRVSSTELQGIKNREETLYGKQGRGRSFATIEERDEFLQKQIDSLETQVKSKKELLKRLRGEIKDAERTYQSETNNIAKAEKETSAIVDRIDEINKLSVDKTAYRNQLQEARKQSWRELEALQDQMSEAKQELERGRQQLNTTLPRHISQGIASVIRIVQEKKLDGYYGPLIDNLDLKNPAFRTAVEVAAGNALFHIIVSTDEMAAVLMKELEKRKAGRLTFLPLNRLKVEQTTYPDSNDVRPLIDVALDYEPEVEAAIRQVFGKKLLARDLETAALFSKEFQLDAITKDGDVVNRKGGFEGGYRDDRVSKMGAVSKIKESGARLEELRAEENDLKQKSEDVDQTVNEVMRELNKLDAEREHLKTKVQQQGNDTASRKRQLEPTRTQLDNRKKGLESLDVEIASSETLVAEYREEQGSPLLDRLSENDRDELRRLSERAKTLLEITKTLDSELIQIVASRDSLKAHLRDNLYKRRDELNDVISSESISGIGDLEGAITNARAERSHLSALSSSISKEIAEMEISSESKRKEMKSLETNLEKLRTEERKEEDTMNEATKVQDNMLNKRTIILENIQQKQRLIRDLGTLPRKELEDFKSLSEKQMLRQLREVNEELKKYASVNRKALDQYINFSEQRDILEERKQQLENDRQSIKTLLVILDQQKEEAILRTFKGVSHFFSEVFHELVPGGQGSLIMRTTDDGDAGDQDEDGDGSATASFDDSTSAISKFQGVQVRVSFSGGGQQYEMQQLSGGQKALVALALIFAIQRCDPAPFYLFDEVDQALDANYRAGVARLIQRQAESTDAPAQFITTTFRPELVDVSHKCYGIALQNKVSSIYALDKSEAQSFVTNLMTEEEAVGQVSAIPTYSKQSGLRQVTEGEEENISPIVESRTSRGSKHDYVDTGEGGSDDDGDGDEEEDGDSESELMTKKSSTKRGRSSRRLQKMSIGDD